jgi:hypothetical protein
MIYYAYWKHDKAGIRRVPGPMESESAEKDKLLVSFLLVLCTPFGPNRKQMYLAKLSKTNKPCQKDPK